MLTKMFPEYLRGLLESKVSLRSLSIPIYIPLLFIYFLFPRLFFFLKALGFLPFSIFVLVVTEVYRSFGQEVKSTIPGRVFCYHFNRFFKWPALLIFGSTSFYVHLNNLHEIEPRIIRLIMRLFQVIKSNLVK
jgi:hypothetical protein